MPEGGSLFLKSSLVALSATLFLSMGILAPVSAEKVLNGQVCSERVGRLTTDIQWQKSVDEAKEAAKKEKKLIFWVNMLGKLEGDT